MDDKTYISSPPSLPNYFKNEQYLNNKRNNFFFFCSFSGWFKKDNYWDGGQFFFGWGNV